MNQFRTLLYAILLSLSVTVCAESQSYVALDTGYRWDSLFHRVTTGGPNINNGTTNQRLKNINTYQLGAKGQYTFCNSAFIRGSGHYGWLGKDGDYDDAGIAGKLVGHTIDADGSVGYYFCVTDCWSVAPVAGWSYDQLHVKGKGIHELSNGRVLQFPDIKANNRFRGPYLGFDILFQPNTCFDFSIGYEFHWARWYGQRIIDGPQSAFPPAFGIAGLSSVRKVHNVLGQVIKFDVTGYFWDCWQAGLQLKYRNFYGDNGKYKQTITPIPPTFTFARVDGLVWDSFSLMVHVGRSF